MTPFSRILVANRGEIACRIFDTAHALGYETVAIYSDADRDARHVRLAHQAVHVGPSEAAQSYLNTERVVEAARKTKADAIHPGYGFLSENPEFAAACRAHGLVFIGPPTEAIGLMGSKRQAKLRMAEAGVPLIPGYSGSAQSIEDLCTQAQLLGPPLMIKASAGGGGRGLRRLDELSALRHELAAARSEAESTFGDGELILERALTNPRHVEIQVFADRHGQVVHLSERDCSIQRRHQKIVEEAPSPAVNAALRQKMGDAAVAAARAIDYEGAGTVEFLLTDDGHFYFMEMNTRLQVEHPVTEMVTGLDLVAWQIHIAAGQPLPSRTNIVPTNHAIEVRLYAEDPDAGFLPQTGTIQALDWPTGPGLRVDHGLRVGQVVSSFYDPMLAKIVACGANRDEAQRRLIRALDALCVAGVKTNRDYLGRILRHPEFTAGRTSTAFISDHGPDLRADPVSEVMWALAAVTATEAVGPQAWWSTGPARSIVRLSTQNASRRITLEVQETNVTAHCEDASVHLERVDLRPDAISYTRDQIRQTWRLARHGQTIELMRGGQHLCFVREPVGKSPKKTTRARTILAPMAGKVSAIHASVGDNVEEGAIIVIVEAMKMHLELTAEQSGPVATIRVKVGDQVQKNDVLVELEDAK